MRVVWLSCVLLEFTLLKTLFILQELVRQCSSFRHSFTAIHKILILYFKSIDLVEHLFAKPKARRYSLKHLLKDVSTVFYISVVSEKYICKACASPFLHAVIHTNALSESHQASLNLFSGF